MRPLLILFLLFCCDKLLAQQLNLVALFKADRFKAYSEIPPAITSAADRAAVTANGLVILKGIEFKNGRLEIDLQGKDVFQQSFLGIAFNIKDSLHYEVVYFRPFNFSSTDTIRKKHAVQYMSLPDHPWSQLRKEQPNRYEARLSAYQKANDWFHATLAIDNDSVAVYQS
jgi:hypothetical protein